ncbi:DUF4054 domain-containing protein [Erwinia amylovora]|uniref:DUF4054 domain-containing protein n=1 Tax=Erwinia amylovora TaxID=552 RepID=UPI001443C8CC|nr:DUF4054 domain-containing protein [Erwinia amylovora]
MDAGTFPLEAFRVLYPQFNDVPADDLFLIAKSATCYFPECQGICSSKLWMRVAAHRLMLRQMAANGGSPSAAVTSATIDKVSVSFAAPLTNANWSYWYNLTPSGQQCLALIKRCRVTRYIGGMGERAAFRRVGGCSRCAGG